MKIITYNIQNHQFSQQIWKTIQDIHPQKYQSILKKMIINSLQIICIPNAASMSKLRVAKERVDVVKCRSKNYQNCSALSWRQEINFLQLYLLTCTPTDIASTQILKWYMNISKYKHTALFNKVSAISKPYLKWKQNEDQKDQEQFCKMRW